MSDSVKVECFRGQQHDYEVMVFLMDDTLREQIHNLGIDSEQEFFDQYASWHRQKFGEEFPPIHY